MMIISAKSIHFGHGGTVEIRSYRTAADQTRARKVFQRMGANYFTAYADTQGIKAGQPFSLWIEFPGGVTPESILRDMRNLENGRGGLPGGGDPIRARGVPGLGFQAKDLLDRGLIRRDGAGYRTTLAGYCTR